MNIHSNQRLFSMARAIGLFRAWVLLISVARLAHPVFAADAKEPAPIEHMQPAEPGSQHASAVRNGVLSTRDGLTLRLTTDLGSVNIVQLEAGRAPVVPYTMHIKTYAPTTPPHHLPDSYSLTAT